MTVFLDMPNRTAAQMKLAQANERRYRELRLQAQRRQATFAWIALTIIAALATVAITLGVSVSVTP